MSIYLKEVFKEIALQKEQIAYKIHFARKDRWGTNPLDVFMCDEKRWEVWNTYSSGKDDFNRDYIFSLIDFYPEQDTWLFGGIWKVVNKDFSNKENNNPYYIELSEQYKEFIGRLKITYPYKDRTTRPKMEKHFDSMIVKELLQEQYSIMTFPGYREVHLAFSALENIVRKDAISWKNALSVKGIYLINDLKAKKKYIGKASGESGVWGRWSEYIRNGHGGNVTLKKIMEDSDKGWKYVKDNYVFTLLEHLGSWEESEIDSRESYWKNVFGSRSEYNEN